MHADGTFVRTVTAGQRLADNRDRLRLRRVSIAEIAPGADGNIHRAEIVLVGDADVSYTPRAEDAVAAVDRGEAEAAFLLRPTRIEDVFAVAERGETMPQKSTYFYPKLVSGLLFQPL